MGLCGSGGEGELGERGEVAAGGGGERGECGEVLVAGRAEATVLLVSLVVPVRGTGVSDPEAIFSLSSTAYAESLASEI